MTRGPASPLIRAAIRADVEARIEDVAARLEATTTRLSGEEELIRELEAALTEVTGIVAEGLMARIRETRPAPI